MDEITDGRGFEPLLFHIQGIFAVSALFQRAAAVMASSSVGGLSGAFIPVSEDEGMIAAAKSGTLTLSAVLTVSRGFVPRSGSASRRISSVLLSMIYLRYARQCRRLYCSRQWYAAREPNIRVCDAE